MFELAQHRITRIETAEVAGRYPRTVGKNSHLGSHGEGITAPIVLISTDRGAAGWGRLGWPADNLSRFVGQRVADLFDPAQGVIVDEALALDFALHDLAGVILNQPV